MSFNNVGQHHFLLFEWILTRYIYFIMEMKILKKTYIAYRGIPQGTSASTRLCDLYLGSMERKYWPGFFQDSSTLLLRYFLLTLLDGVGDGYDMQADPIKTQINFLSPLLSKYIHLITVIGLDDYVLWCGYEIFPRILKVYFWLVKKHYSRVTMVNIIMKTIINMYTYIFIYLFICKL
uniref:Telomerase reverse transcriptase n=1 Tax=Syphacia muris TaxID=451379 RepID=A0A0N5B0Z2_9BILA